MPRIHEYPAPSLPINTMALVPVLEGGGSDGSRAAPLFAMRNVPTGEVLALRRPMIADLSATTDADPGAGKLRWNNVDPDSATEIYIDDVDDAETPADLSATLATLSVGGYLYVQAAGDANRDTWQIWQVTSNTDASGYTKIGVSLQDSAGTFVADEALEVSFQQPSPSPGVDRNVVSTLSISSGVVTVDCSLGDYFTLALTANVTGWNFTNVPAGASIMIEITQDATARTVAWPSSFKWAGGSAGAVSTGSGAKDVLAISTFNTGTAWRATLAKDFA